MQMEQENSEVTQIHQKLSVKSKCNTPAPKFPELRTKHKMPVILVYPQPDFEGNIFLCSRTVANNLSELNSNYDNLMVYDDFIRYLAEPSGLEYTPSEEVMNLIQTKESKINQFAHHVNQQKNDISTLSSSLQELYTGKCQELVGTLQNVLEKQKDIFSQNYQSFESEVQADKEKDADISKFTEIKNAVQEMNDPEEIEKYFREILRKKQSWEKASEQLRTVGTRTEAYFREKVEQHYADKPTFVQTEAIIEQWKEGLNNLINKVISQNVNVQSSSCFNGLFNMQDGIAIDISVSDEMRLLTKAMIKETTHLNLNFEKKPIDEDHAKEIAESLTAINNLVNLNINFDCNQLTNELLEIVLGGVQECKDLKHLKLSLFGNKLGNTCGAKIGTTLKELAKLTHLTINLEMNEVSCKGVEGIVEGLQELVNLTTLELNFKNNTISVSGAVKLGECLEKLEKISSLNINLGGYSQIQNKLKEEGAKSLCRCIHKMTQLETLNIDLGFTGVNDICALELATSIKVLNCLQKVNIGLYNNDLHSQGAIKVVKALSKRPFLKDVSLNLNNNSKIKNEGASNIISDLRRMQSLSKLELLMKQIGLNKDQGKTFKADLLNQKTGNNFDSLEVFV